VLKTPEVSKKADTDSEGNKGIESGEETAATPTSTKRNKLIPNERIKTKLSPEMPFSKKRIGLKIAKPPLCCDSFTVSNHLEFHIHLSNKKTLYYNMKMYYESLGEDPFDHIPLTYHIKDGVDSEEFEKFSEEYNRIEEEIESEKGKKKPHNIWIIKPGENTNRGSGISV